MFITQALCTFCGGQPVRCLTLLFFITLRQGLSLDPAHPPSEAARQLSFWNLFSIAGPPGVCSQVWLFMGLLSI